MIETNFIKKFDRQIDCLQSQLKQKDFEIEQLKQLVIEAEKQTEKLVAENLELEMYKCLVENGTLVEQKLRRELEEAQARIKELEENHLYPAATKKDPNGNTITNDVIVQLFKRGMNPNQISKYLGNITHQAIRARLKKLGLYGKRRWEVADHDKR